MVRAAATVRVVIWHATGAAWVTLVAAMPLMFFVSGHLYAKSLQRRNAGGTMLDRLRRLAFPVWAFAAVSWVVMAVAAAATGGGLTLSRLPMWFVPLLDPQGSAWEQGWLSTPLWYMRVLLQLVVLAPVLIACVRRWPVATVTSGAAAVVLVHVLERANLWSPGFDERFMWHAGDLVLYGTFFALGAIYDRETARRRRRSVYVAAASALAAAAALWWALDPPPEGIVNNSHPIHLLIGSVWVALALAGAGLVRGAAANPWVGAAVHWFGRRALTVYLWHTSAIAVALWLLDAGTAPGAGRTPAWWSRYAVLVVALTALLAAVWGWVEDLSARRRPRLWPDAAGRHTGDGPRPQRRGRAAIALGAVAAVCGVVVAPLIAATSSTTPYETAQGFRPRVPSQAPPLPSFESTAGAAARDETGSSGPSEEEPGLQARLRNWADSHGLAGAAAAVSYADSAPMVAASGVDASGEPRSASDRLALESVTKLFTANLVYRAVDAGLIDLDAPISTVGSLAELPYADRITPRSLLTHRSGVVNYRDTEDYLRDPASMVEPIDAVSAALAGTAESELGTTRYSSTNYLVLGMLLEQATGRTFDDLLRGELLDPLELPATSHLPSEPGEPRFATGGLVADLADLTRAGAALLRSHVGISDTAFDTMTRPDLEAGMGAGTMDYCPCNIDEDGVARSFAIGYAGGDVLLVYVPSYDAVVAVAVTGGYTGGIDVQDAIDLVQALARDHVVAEAPEAVTT